jgi:glycosyltransferase involved in cell wall biosynthesis
MSIAERAESRVHAHGRPSGDAPHIVFGITHPQTCLNLTGRLRAFRDAGFRVTLVSGPGELLERTAREQDAQAIALPMKRRVAPLADLISFFRLWRLMRRLRPEVTEFSSPKAGFLGTFAAWLAGVPVRVYMLRGLKLERTRGIKQRLLLAAERMAARCAHEVLCNSRSVQEQAAALGIASEVKLKLLGSGSSNGVNAERFSPGASRVREQFGIPTAAPVLGFVGRFTRDKGVPELLDAFEEIARAEPEAHLLMVGWFDAAEDELSSRDRARIRSQAHIHCTEGRVDDTAPYYRAMDVLVLPTWREGFPNVVLEAAATGVPAVTTESTGARDSVVPEVTGLLIPAGYPGAIVEAVLALLRDAERRRRMGEAARAWVTEHFSDAHVLGLTVEFYKTLLEKKRPRLPRS